MTLAEGCYARAIAADADAIRVVRGRTDRARGMERVDSLSLDDTAHAEDGHEEYCADTAMSTARVQTLPKTRIVARNACAITGASDFEPLLTLRDFPVGMYCVPEDWDGVEYVADMRWCVSKSSGVIQLAELIEAETLYDCQHESGAIGGLWKRHHEEFCEFIDAYGCESVLEIGSGHGHLAKEFVARRRGKCRWTMVEPNLPGWLLTGDHPSEIHPISAWFGDSFELPKDVPKIDAVVHSHTFEHIYDYDEFLRNVARMEPKFQIFSVPHQREWLARGWQNSIMFEHPQLLTPKAIEYIMSRHGFELQGKKVFADGHSMFYAFSYVGNASKSETSQQSLDEYAENKRLFRNWLKSNVDFVQGVNDRIDEATMNGEKPTVYMFGAHIFTQYLVSFGLRISAVEAILDNAEGKQGKRLYGLPLLVHSPKILSNVERPIVILRVGAYAEEIKRGILEVNARTVFWE